jgi:hypothetical protein
MSFDILSVYLSYAFAKLHVTFSSHCHPQEESALGPRGPGAPPPRGRPADRVPPSSPTYHRLLPQPFPLFTFVLRSASQMQQMPNLPLVVRYRAFAGGDAAATAEPMAPMTPMTPNINVQ